LRISSTVLRDGGRNKPDRMILLYAIGLYLAIGLVTAVAFVSVGLPHVLPHGMTASLGARLLFIPGATALWPYVLTRWMRTRDVS